MNYKTNWYGAIGLASTIGKNGFAAGQAVSGGGQWIFQKVRENLIELKMDIALVGEIKVFESLENFSQWSAEKAKSYQVKCEEWESWAEQKFAEAKKQEELNEDWEWNANPSFAFTKNYPGLVGKKGIVKRLKEKYFPQTKLETPEKAIYRPNCLRYLGIYF